MSLGAITAAGVSYTNDDGYAHSVGRWKEAANPRNTHTQASRNAQRSSPATPDSGEAVSVASRMKASTPLLARQGSFSNIVRYIRRSSPAIPDSGELVSVAALMRASTPLLARQGFLSNIVGHVGVVTESALAKVYAATVPQVETSPGEADSVDHVG